MTHFRLVILLMVPVLCLSAGCMHERYVVAEIALRDAQTGEPVSGAEVSAAWTQPPRWNFGIGGSSSAGFMKYSGRTDAEGHITFGPMPEGFWIIELLQEPSGLFYTSSIRARVDAGRSGERHARWEVIPPYDRVGLQVDEGPAIEFRVIGVVRRSDPRP